MSQTEINTAINNAEASLIMAVLLIILSVLSLLFYRRINTKGVKAFEAL